MYFSRIRIKNNPEGLKLILDLQANGSYSAHQIIWELFPNTVDRKFIFRQETISSPGEYLPIEYLVISSILPVSNRCCLIVESKDYAPSIKAGDIFNFKLRANPTISRTNDPNKRGRTHDVMMDAKFKFSKEVRNNNPLMVSSEMEKAAISWLTSENRSTRFGYKIKSVTISAQTQHEIFQPKSNNSIFYTSVDYDGFLVVTNPDDFITLLFSGIGKAKSFGCGLMTIRKII